ncbi:hypothetical protein FJTKL_03153 [Diaporthe vaccinii]|uniref:Uncharacterized protein n=1 Tax=Diaporthe vaccinii TaxID=105482 RepID=A0ABR4DVZ9_9PEZI
MMYVKKQYGTRYSIFILDLDTNAANTDCCQFRIPNQENVSFSPANLVLRSRLLTRRDSSGHTYPPSHFLAHLCSSFPIFSNSSVQAPTSSTRLYGSKFRCSASTKTDSPRTIAPLPTSPSSLPSRPSASQALRVCSASLSPGVGSSQMLTSNSLPGRKKKSGSEARTEFLLGKGCICSSRTLSSIRTRGRLASDGGEDESERVSLTSAAESWMLGDVRRAWSMWCSVSLP